MSTTSSDAGCGINISAGIGRSGERPAPSGKRRASTSWRDSLCISSECRRGKAPGEPYDGKRHVRFDEGTLETERWARLRHRHMAKAAGQQSSLALRPPRQRPTLQAGRDCDIGDVGYPQLVRAIQFHVLREIGEDRIIVIAIRRRDKTPALPWIQRMLAHEPADLLGVHDNATMA